MNDFLHDWLGKMSEPSNEGDPKALSIEIPGKGIWYLFTHVTPKEKIGTSGAVYCISSEAFPEFKQRLSEIRNEAGINSLIGDSRRAKQMGIVANVSSFGDFGLGITLFNNPANTSEKAEGVLTTLTDNNPRNPLRTAVSELLQVMVKSRMGDVGKLGTKKTTMIVRATVFGLSENHEQVVEGLFLNLPHDTFSKELSDSSFTQFEGRIHISKME